ncbi:hypothetical protein CDD83_2626 [Cordyceps sp. RAO-2017]|nr:hypothetical protein CDD83_2626 [Cordyceps sp. RAO-2017]
MASGLVRDGVFAINKPCGQSSAQILRECQEHFNPSALFKPMIEASTTQRLKQLGGHFKRERDRKKASQVKIGHGGTLDPLATGVLIVGIGSATKMLSQFLDCIKTYETVVVFGASTDTYDRVGRVLSKRPYQHITRDMVLRELENFRGKRKQTPPLYSALKMDGKPLYVYAREGKPIPREIEARDVDVLDIELVEWYEPGTHHHRWPVAEADAAERNIAEQVWKAKKLQETSKKLTPEEKEEDDQAIAAHESFKRKFEERQDELIVDKPLKKRRQAKEPLMSGALGTLPQTHQTSKGNIHVPSIADLKNTPPPWSDEGPPACKVRLTVTSGYYVRSFCHDLGTNLDSAAIMAELCRVRQSDFTVGGVNTLEYDDLAKGEAAWGPKLANMLARWNGEPEVQWPEIAAPNPGLSPARAPSPPRKQDRGQANSARLGSRSPQPEKRKRSPSADRSPPSPRKRLAGEAGDDKTAKPSPRANGTQGRSEDEKSWNGIDD